jgi:hypothetical protein
MSVAEFLTWEAPADRHWQLVDGEPIAMAPASRTHDSLQHELGRLIGNHLVDTGSPCTVVTAPGIVPQVRSSDNFRIPDLAVTCTRYDIEEYDVSNPVLIVEILSPSNRADTWRNVWAFATIPGLHEILFSAARQYGRNCFAVASTGAGLHRPRSSRMAIWRLRALASPDRLRQSTGPRVSRAAETRHRGSSAAEWGAK